MSPTHSGVSTVVTVTSIEGTIRDVLAAHGKLAVDAQSVPTSEDLYQLGLTSHASVNVMLGIEDDLDIEFPDGDLVKSTFATIDNLVGVVTRLAEED